MIRVLDAAEVGAFGHVPLVDRHRARVCEVPTWLPGIAATTLGRFVIVRRDAARDRLLLAHELVHVRQWRELGAPRFAAAYLAAYARNRRAGLGHWAAYEAIPFEVEARGLAAVAGA